MSARAEGTAADFEGAYRLLLSDPVGCAQACRDILAKGHSPVITMLLAAALRLEGDLAQAETLSGGLARDIPRWAGAHFEHGMALARLGRRDEAMQAFGRADRLGGVTGLWREIGEQHWRAGDTRAAETAYLRHLSSATFESSLQEALTLNAAGDRAGAERAFRLHLQHYPDDVLAQRHFAEFCSSLDRYEEAEALLRRCLERAPSFVLGRYGLAMVLLHEHKVVSALEEIERLLTAEPNRLEFLALKADALGRLGDFEGAAACLEGVLALHPAQGAMWANYGHMVRALGRREACEAAYKRAIALNAPVGEAYWGLANLKTYRFSSGEIADMRARSALAAPGDDRVALQFALGKALEDEKDYAGAFESYARANAERRSVLPYDHAEREQFLERARRLYTSAFFATRRGHGAQADDPIFVVGMPRSGSTLIEQILASHSLVEGTMELVELLMMARRLERDGDPETLLAGLSAAECRALGEEYLQRTKVFRRTSAPRFIDKMPNNFLHTGLIHQILPKARIIDVRRDPMACGFSNFKQHWATGQAFSYDLRDIGRFYRAYVDLMAHFDAVLPGRVHRVIYEDLVADPEAETRRLLAACGLPFEEGCLRFFENNRAVRTPSSEQVRRPVNREGLDGWRPFEPWLGPLKEALGPVLDAYPRAPRI